MTSVRNSDKALTLASQAVAAGSISSAAEAKIVKAVRCNSGAFDTNAIEKLEVLGRQLADLTQRMRATAREEQSPSTAPYRAPGELLTGFLSSSVAKALGRKIGVSQTTTILAIQSLGRAGYNVVVAVHGKGAPVSDANTHYLVRGASAGALCRVEKLAKDQLPVLGESVVR